VIAKTPFENCLNFGLEADAKSWSRVGFREPLCGLALAEETMKIIYAGHLSAEDGRRISL
jgi:hypothetical protein